MINENKPFKFDDKPDRVHVDSRGSMHNRTVYTHVTMRLIHDTNDIIGL